MEYPKILEAYRSTKQGEITIKSIVVTNRQEEQNFREQYKKHSIKGRPLTEEEKEQGENLVLPKEEKDVPLIDCLDLCLSWFARDVDEFNFSDLTPTIYVSLSEFMASVIKLYPQLNNYRFNYFNQTILKKLVKDNYLFFDDYTQRYGITIDGILFIQSGGYGQQREDIILQRNRLRIDNERNIRVNRLLVFGSILAGIGAIALAAIEIYKICRNIH